MADSVVFRRSDSRSIFFIRWTENLPQSATAYSLNRYLQGANGKSKLHRKYLDFFDKTDFSEIAFSQKCPFILNHQCIRNQSLLRALISENKIDNGYFVLLHHDLNESIKKEWDLYLNNLSDKAKKEVLKISASDLVKESANENFRNYFKDRYLI